MVDRTAHELRRVEDALQKDRSAYEESKILLDKEALPCLRMVSLVLNQYKAGDGLEKAVYTLASLYHVTKDLQAHLAIVERFERHLERVSKLRAKLTVPEGLQ